MNIYTRNVIIFPKTTQQESNRRTIKYQKNKITILDFLIHIQRNLHIEYLVKMEIYTVHHHCNIAWQTCIAEPDMNKQFILRKSITTCHAIIKFSFHFQYIEYDFTTFKKLAD